MSKYSNLDDYTDPDTGVLFNKLGITDARLLAQEETRIVAARAFLLARRPLPGDFDLDHLKRLHRYLFGDIFAWAGKFRTTNIAKGNTMFAHFQHLESAGAAIIRELHKENCLRGLPDPQFASRAAYYLGEINALHPFREGNGRTQREFISHLTYQNNRQIEWPSNQAEMIAASIAATNGDCSLYEIMIAKGLTSRPPPRPQPSSKVRKKPGARPSGG